MISHHIFFARGNSMLRGGCIGRTFNLTVDCAEVMKVILHYRDHEVKTRLGTLHALCSSEMTILGCFFPLVFSSIRSKFSSSRTSPLPPTLRYSHARHLPGPWDGLWRHGVPNCITRQLDYLPDNRDTVAVHLSMVNFQLILRRLRIGMEGDSNNPNVSPPPAGLARWPSSVWSGLYSVPYSYKNCFFTSSMELKWIEQVARYVLLWHTIKYFNFNRPGGRTNPIYGRVIPRPPLAAIQFSLREICWFM